MIRDIQTRIISKLMVLGSMEPIFFESNSSSDERGTVSFTNDLNLQKAVRTYKVENSQLKTVRAWHGHKLEEKWVNVEQGEFLVCVVKVDDFTSPSKNSEIQTYKMSPKDGFLYIPPNFANGAMNLTEDNAIRYYSSLTLEESLNDDFRFESDYWDPWSQHSPNFYE
jgi:dTDP-4-dehydrorhamnose 3,5-epimerase-like enzyme